MLKTSLRSKAPLKNEQFIFIPFSEKKKKKIIFNIFRQKHNNHWLEFKKIFTEAEFAFSIYDADGSNVIDAVDLGNVLRALNVNPTNATIEKLGGTKKRGEKTMTLEEFLPIFSQVKKDKDQGCYEDFVECLKLYDKAENGTMLGAELTHCLLTLGMFDNAI